ncbi:MAG: 23S rRNA (guanosine(2251)-2'-O)-methyltransferase RlmB [Candidatus Promineifilaceae bacterium]
MTEILTRRNPVEAALNAGRRELHKLWIQKDLNRKTIAPILHAASKRNVPIREASKQEISNRAQDGRHQGLLLEAGPYTYSTLNDILGLSAQRGEKPFLLLFDLLHGPQNIGSLLRTAEICGVHGVILQDRRAPDITPAVVQYSAGAAEYLLIAQVTNLARAIDHLKEQGIWIAGLDIDESAMQFGKVDLDRPLALVIGHEGSGLRRITKKHCDFLIRLPMRGQTESLNAAAAGSVVLYAAWQARGFSGM